MSLYTAPPSAISEPDLLELLNERAAENVRLEFKREIPQKDELLKKLSAFGNTLGGWLLVGGEASSRDGRLTALPGVEPQAGYKQTIVQWCFDGVAPPLDVEVSDPIPLTHVPGKVCYVIRVRESDLGPHFLNGRKGVYVRTDEFSARFEAKPANDNELRQLLNRRELVRHRRDDLVQRARRRFDVFTDQKYSELGRKKARIGARFDLSIGPRFPARTVCGQAALLSLVKTKTIPWRQVGFPRARSEANIVSQHESVIVLNPGSSFSILEANTWGSLFYATEIELEHPAQIFGIHVYHLVGQLLVFLEHAGQVLVEIGYVGPLQVVMRMQAVRGVPWLYAGWANVPEVGPASILDDTVEFSLDTTTTDLTRRRDALLLDVLRFTFYATNWAEAVEAAQMETYIKGGYRYNFWQLPSP